MDFSSGREMPHEKSVNNDRSKSSTTNIKTNLIKKIDKSEMELKIIDQLKEVDQTEETQELTNMWRHLVKPDEYRMSGGDGRNTIP